MILIIETSSLHCSVALCDKNGVLLGEKIAEESNAHAEYLGPAVRDLFLECKVDMDSLIAVAISSGPGSYTGLRIGTSFAKGICFAKQLPLIPVNPLFGLFRFASNQSEKAALFLCMVDARRDEVYLEMYDRNGIEVLPVQPMVLKENALRDFAQKSVCICGNANEKFMQIMSHFTMLESVNCGPRASMMVEEAVSKWKLMEFADLAYYEPNYLKEYLPGVKKKR